VSSPLKYLLIPLWFAVLAGLHYYLWLRLARDTGLSRRWRRIAAGVIGGFAISFPAVLAWNRFAPGDAARIAAWPAFLWLGTFLYLLMTVAAIGLARRVVHRVRRTEVDPGRREFLARVTAGAAVGVAGTVVGVGIVRARGRPEVTEVPIELDRLPAALDGFRIVQLSDLHAGNTLGRGFVEDLVETTNAARPDLIAFTGDIADGLPDHLRDVVAPLAELRAPHGVYYVTGNHDYYIGADPWLDRLRELGIQVLRNERVSIGEGADSFDLVGIDDFEAERFGIGHGADLGAAIDGRDPVREMVLLAHQPKQVESAAEHGVGLMLSGHTHGGQVWPWHYAAKIQQRGYLAGHYRRGDTQLYVHRGSGYWGPPIRVCASPEVARITLRAPAQGRAA